MKGIKNIARIICLILITTFTHAQGNLELVENKGQWDNKVKFKANLSTGAFFLHQSGYTMLLHKPEDLTAVREYYHGHSHDEQKAPTTSPKGGILRSHAYEVKFLNANSNPVLIPEKPLDSYNNYFIGSDASKWAGNCKIYQAITYKNMYPNVDVRYYTDNGTMKYDILVHPGGDVAKIALQFNGTDGIKTSAGNLLIKTSVGDVKELSPYTYQTAVNGKQAIECSYKIQSNIVTFRTANYDKSKTLVIDPSLIISTFSGSTADNWGYTATYDRQGNFYAGGIVFGQGFPTSTGAFQTVYGGGRNEGVIGGYDIGIMKFNPNGTNRIYATYIGGDDNEQPHSLIVDATNNLVLSGRTRSNNYPVNRAIYGPGGLPAADSANWGWNIIITKLNATGSQILGSRKYGGKLDDGVNIRPKYEGSSGAESIRQNYGDDSRSEVILDGAGDILLASCTQSNDFPTTPGAVQTTNNSTSTNSTVGNVRQDGVVMKISSDVSNVLFSTYLGGNNDDAAFVISINPGNQNIYVAGATASNDFPGDKSGTINASFQGGISDGFVTILNNTGTAIIKTTYIGTNNIDLVFGLKFDRLGNPYICGTSTGSNNLSSMIVNAPFSQPGGKQFISKLRSDLSAYQYSTIFGTSGSVPNISPTAFLVDRCQNVYVAGWGGSIANGYTSAGTLGLPVVGGPIQPNTDGKDFYFFVLERDAQSQLFGSFFGQTETATSTQEHVDGGTSRFDEQGIIYQAICANCGRGAFFPTTPGAWSSTNASTNCNFAALKIEMNFAGVGSAVQSSVGGVRDTSGCVPLNVTFTDTIGNGKRFIWNFGDGSPNVITTVPTTNHTYNQVGLFDVMLVSIDSSTCNIADTSYSKIRVRNDDALVQYSTLKLPPCQSFTYQFTNTSVFPPGKPFNANSFKWVFGDGTTQIAGAQTVTHAYPAPGTYITRLVLLDTNYCNAPDSVEITLRIAENVRAQFTTPPSGCVPYNAVFNNTSLAGQQFFWDFGDGTTSAQTNPTHLYSTPGNYTIKLIAVDSATCNIVDSTQFTIVVSDFPTANFTYSPIPPQPNTQTQFNNTSTGAVRYKWDFGDGDTLATFSLAPVFHQFNSTGTFNVCLTAINQFGCIDTTCQAVVATIVPAMDVPNAFTPNGDGQNDKIFVRGFGIDKLTWRIFNRWGKQVFITNDKNEGWDGKVNGVLQPQEVYHYVLDVEFSDGTRTQKKGDITLLR